MIRLKSIGIAIAIICSLFLFLMVFLPCVSAQLAIDEHAPPVNGLNASGNVTIDSLSYNSGDNTVEVNGTFQLYNWDKKRGVTYDGELRLEIFDMEGNTYRPDSKVEINGSLEKNDEDANWWDVFHSISESTSLHLDCLQPTGDAEPIEADEEYRMSANITLRATGFHENETWDVPYSTTFEHKPEIEVDQLEGLGPTKDGDTFSGDCVANTNNERSSWQSLIYTEGPYHAVYWSVKAPGDTSAHGSSAGISFGDGVTRKSTMITSFPDDVDDPNIPGNEVRVYYEITAYVYRWDQSVYWKSYLVDVFDKMIKE